MWALCRFRGQVTARRSRIRAPAKSNLEARLRSAAGCEAFTAHCAAPVDQEANVQVPGSLRGTTITPACYVSRGGVEPAAGKSLRRPAEEDAGSSATGVQVRHPHRYCCLV